MKAKRFLEIEDTSRWNNDANLRSCTVFIQLFLALCYNFVIILGVDRYFGAAKDLPGVRELFEQERKYAILSCYYQSCDASMFEKELG